MGRHGVAVAARGWHFCLLELARLRSHEQVDESALRALAAEIQRDGRLLQPVIVDAESLVILDGHHRVSALRDLGCRLVPAYLVDYGDPAITVGSWRAETPPVSKDDVVQAGYLGRPFPPKTSRHCFGPTPPAERPVALEALGRRGLGDRPS